MWNQMGSRCLLVLIGSKVLVMMNSLQNIVISGVQGLLWLMGSKLLIKMTRSQNTVIYLSVLRPGHLYQKFWSHCIRKSWAPETTMTKTFKPIKTRSIGCSFDFTYFLARPVLVLGHSFSYLGCFINVTGFEKSHLPRTQQQDTLFTIKR